MKAYSVFSSSLAQLIPGTGSTSASPSHRSKCDFVANQSAALDYHPEYSEGSLPGI